MIGNRVYQFKSLPFGLSTTPRVFTKCLAPVTAFLRQRGGDHISIPRRLASGGSIRTLCDSRHSAYPLRPCTSASKHGEVQVNTVSTCSVYRCPSGLLAGASLSPRRETHQTLYPDCFVSPRSDGHCPNGTETTWPYGIYNSHCPTRETQNALAPGVVPFIFPPFHRPPCHPPSSFRGTGPSIAMVDEPTDLTNRPPLHPTMPSVQITTDACLMGWGAHCKSHQIHGM